MTALTINTGINPTVRHFLSILLGCLSERREVQNNTFHTCTHLEMANEDLATTGGGGKDSENGTGKNDLKDGSNEHPAKLGTPPHTVNAINSATVMWFKNQG